MKKMIALLLALIMVFSLVACSGSADTAQDTTTTDSTTDSTTTDTADTTGSDTTAEPASTEGSVINVCLASEPDTIDPALNSAVDGATMLAHLFSGLAKWSQDADGNLQIVADAATELPEGVEMVMPGDNVTMTVQLIAPIAMQEGLRFAIREGGHTVGAGVVSKIIE